jgi:hypothetical protein
MHMPAITSLLWSAQLSLMLDDDCGDCRTECVWFTSKFQRLRLLLQTIRPKNSTSIIFSLKNIYTYVFLKDTVSLQRKERNLILHLFLFDRPASHSAFRHFLLLTKSWVTCWPANYYCLSNRSFTSFFLIF